MTPTDATMTAILISVLALSGSICKANNREDQWMKHGRMHDYTIVQRVSSGARGQQFVHVRDNQITITQNNTNMHKF